MKRKVVASLLCAAMAVSLLAGCAGGDTSKEDTKTEDTAKEEKKEPEKDIQVDEATSEEVQAYMNDSDENTILIDARPQEAYSGWALEGAKNGGHLKNSALFSARWLDCEYTEAASREVYLERAMEDQGISEDKEIIVYDYSGEQALEVAKYLKE